MKKILIISLFIPLLVACASHKIIYDYSKLINEITTVELFFYDNEEDYELLRTVEEKVELKDFLNDFSKLELKKTYGAPFGISEYCIRLTYKNNDTESITQQYWETKNNDNVITARSNISCDKEYFNSLINILKQ